MQVLHLDTVEKNVNLSFKVEEASWSWSEKADLNCWFETSCAGMASADSLARMGISCAAQTSNLVLENYPIHMEVDLKIMRYKQSAMCVAYKNVCVVSLTELSTV